MATGFGGLLASEEKLLLGSGEVRVAAGGVQEREDKHGEEPVSNDELLDLVDDHDRVIGTERRSKVYARGLSNFRVVNAFVVNSRGKLWIPRRTADKRVSPLCLDASMGGHVESGETYEEALRRELKEELNLVLAETPFRFLGRLTPHEHGVTAFMKVYEIKMDTTPDFNRRDFMESFWLESRGLIERIEAGEKTKGDLPKLVRKFYLNGGPQ